MRIDVSEIKTFKECKRKHYLSSRNYFHVVPTIPADNLRFGTIFHECLHSLYLGTPIDKILKYIDNNITDRVQWVVMTNMLKGYYEGPYQTDLVDYEVIDIEKSFEYLLEDLVNPDTGEPIMLCGSIDMLVKDKNTNMLVGFEHKTAKNFRPDIYDAMDEQPRVYFWAMKKILDDWHAKGQHLDIVGVDKIILNQVKKVQRVFDYKRVDCKYTDIEIKRFMSMLKLVAIGIDTEADDLPDPGFMKCQMCDYATVCGHYGYKAINKDEMLEEFEGEFKIREQDHLEDKTNRIITGDEVAQTQGEGESFQARKHTVNFATGKVD